MRDVLRLLGDHPLEKGLDPPTLVLLRRPQLLPRALEKEVNMLDLVIDKRLRDLGGFAVGRLLPYAARRSVGPFVFFDHMGPVELAAGRARQADVQPHPHIGLSTLTYLFEGEIMHRDSVGSAQPIRPGEVNWMTAGRGITHSERFERAELEGGRLNGAQVWVALPEPEEECEPAFSHHEGGELPVFGDRALRGRLLAGEAFGVRAAVPTHSPLFFAHVDLAAGGRAELPAAYSERGAFIVTGRVAVDGQGFDAGKLLVFARGAAAIEAESAATLLVFGGEPLGRRFIEWNFVSSSQERVQQAKADWRAGRMKLPEGDDREYIPLPPDPCPPPNAMS